MDELDLPRPHLFIAALGRSGSTMLANLFSTPPRRWVLVEPRFANASTGNDILVQAREMGLQIDDDEWLPQPGETATSRTARVFAARLSELDRWGVKEVRPDLLASTLAKLDPLHTIVLVRDLRDAAVSLLEKMTHDDNPRYDEEWMKSYLTDSPLAILDFCAEVAGRSHRIVRYEDLVSDPTVTADLAAWLDWPLDGRPDRNLASLFNRDREVRLHGQTITTEAIGRRERSSHPGAQALIEWVETTHGEFQSRFGYETSH